MRPLRDFFEMNRGLCKRVESYLPQAKVHFAPLYEEEVARYMNSKPEQVIVDVGGGRSCRFARRRNAASKARIVAVDISEEELGYNRDVDEVRVADVTRGLPFGDAEIDLIASRAVLEHLDDVEGFVSETTRTLKQGGYSIHLFPSKFALFALVNQALPKKLASSILYFFLPESRGVCGFPAVYDRCYHSAIKALLERHGFEVVETQVSWYQSPYFNFFFPLFLASAFYEALLYALDVKDLCAYVIVVARKT